MRIIAEFISAAILTVASLSCLGGPSSVAGEGCPYVKEFVARTPDTKTGLADGHTVWSSGDRIRVFYDEGESVAAWIKSGIGTPVATFETSVPPSDAYYAVYPADAASSLAGGSVTVTIPSLQTGTFAAGHIAVAKATGNIFSFANVNCFLKISLREAVYSRIAVESVAGNPLSGTIGIAFEGNSAVIGDVADGRSASVEYNPMKTIPAGDVYLSILPGVSHEEGLTINCYRGDILKNSYKIEKEITAEASCILSWQEPEQPEPPTDPEDPQPGDPSSIKVTTFNIRSAAMSEESSEREWSNRREGVYAWFSVNKPDVVCTQECQPNQRTNIVENCPDYSAVYHTSSPNVIFYRKEAFSVQSYGTFWLVEGAPTYVAKTSVQRQDRCATWMKCTFYGHKMLVIDTHLNYRTAQSPDQRSEEMQQLRFYEIGVINTWVAEHYNPATDGYLLFMADFNIDPGNAIFDQWKDGTYGYYARDAAPGADTGRTFNDWGSGNKQTIDHQFYRGFPSVLSYTVDRNAYGGYTYISDHWPVTVVYGL